MSVHEVPPSIWLPNIVVFIIGGSVSALILARNRHPHANRSRNIILTIAVLFLFLLLTFWDSGIDNVHRWIALGPLRFHVASIGIPFFIMQLWRLLKAENWWFSFLPAAATSLLLFLQPDASQLTAFTVSMAILLWSRADRSILRFVSVGLLFIFAVISWINLDHLLPVPYVEKILYLVADMGMVWLLVEVLSIFALIAPFLLLHSAHAKIVSIAFGVHFAVLFLTALFGNFPVPIIGYGVSPMIGYIIALTSIIRARNDLPCSWRRSFFAKKHRAVEQSDVWVQSRSHSL
ncbi:hypothetical protein [Brevibacillus parabrevis]|uniref:hypothetical protein n=1 Tax=Brevibacillus parabrevis TaxID=54914 RepID=UPI00238069FB|nr:hypothetical protein [Brevibacillus parabrevis]WDV97985.1 hypothetical protein PSE45_13800 [Brevibacillus parabrevis]